MRARDVRSGQLWMYQDLGRVVLFIIVAAHPELADVWTTYDVRPTGNGAWDSRWPAMSAEKYYSECYTLISEGDASDAS